MADSDMFMTQRDSIYDQDRDELYIELQKAITERQCKILQKKEKLKLMIETMNKVNNDFKFALTDRKNMNIEQKNITNHKEMGIMNMKSVKRSRASLETVLSDLENKISTEKAKTANKKKEYKAHIKDAEKTWEEYKLVYEEFPLARKRRELLVNMKKVDIEKKMTVADIESWKRMRELKKVIAARRFYNWGVNLAKVFSAIQEAKTEQMNLKLKNSDLGQEIAKLKSGKKRNPLPQISKNVTPNVKDDLLFTKTQGSEELSAPKMFMFQLPQMMVTSPTRVTSQAKQTIGGSLFNWASQLGSSRLSRLRGSILSKPAMKEGGNEQMKTLTATNILSNSLKENNSEINKKQIPANLTNNKINRERENQLIKNLPIDIRPGEKRKLVNEGDPLSEDKQNEPMQKQLFSIQMPTNKDQINSYKSTVLDNTKSSSNNKKTIVPVLKEQNNEASKKNINPCESSKMKRLISTLTNRMKNTPLPKSNAIQNVENYKARDQPNQVNNNKSNTRATEVPVITDDVMPAVNKTEHNATQKTTEQDLFDSSQQQSDFTTMDTTSPPDVIPVENNSQPLSQSSLTDFNSPLELDEAAKLVYQRIAAESPGFVYPRGDIRKSKLGVVNEAVVRSQYFLNASQDLSLNTPTMNFQEDNQQQQLTFSPPPVDYQPTTINSPPYATMEDNQQQQLTFSPPPVDYQPTTINSPPYGTIGTNNSPAMPLFGKQRAEEQKSSGFDFNFMSEPPKAKSFFSLF